MSADLDLAEHLEDNAVGTVGTDIFVGQIPAGVDTAIGLTRYPGPPPVYEFGKADVTSVHERVQILSRSATEATAFSNADAAHAVLRKVRNQVIESTRYVNVEPLNQPGLLRRDENNRAEVVFNVDAERAP